MKTPLAVIENGKLELNKIIKDTLKNVIPQLELFKGKKICKVDNSLMKSAEVLKTLLPNTDNRTSIFFSFEYSSIKLKFRICKSGGSYEKKPSTAYCEYIEKNVWLGKMDGQILKDVDTLNDIIAGYDLDREPLNMADELAKVEEFIRLKAELSELYDSIDSIVRDDKNLRLR